MYLLQIKVEDGVVKELLGFQCFVIMVPNDDCIRITIRMLQIKLHLSKGKKHVNTNKQKIKQHSTIALDQNFATHM
jgi:preprotein translocase subunit Sec63